MAYQQLRVILAYKQLKLICYFSRIRRQAGGLFAIDRQYFWDIGTIILNGRPTDCPAVTNCTTHGARMGSYRRIVAQVPTTKGWIYGEVKT